MPIDPELYKKYSKETIEKAIDLLSYKLATSLPKTELPDTPTLYVFRHGQTTDNADFIFSGWRDADLTEKGVQQAKALAEKLKDKKIQMLVASDQIRAIKTMEIAMSQNKDAQKLEIIKEPRIKERSYGDLQGQSKILMFLDDPEKLHRYRRDYFLTPPNGESLETVVKRVHGFIDEIMPKMKKFKINVAVSCHGNSMRGFRQYFEHLSNEQTAEIETPLGQDYAAYPIT